MANTQGSGGNIAAPKALSPFINRLPRLLPGETETEYWALFDLLMEDMVPTTNTEWLVLADVVGLFWEIRRFTAWKGAILAVNRTAALESALQQTHPAIIVPGAMPHLIIKARQEAEEWRTDPNKRLVLEARLAAHGYDEETLNAGALIEALVPLATIDRFLSSARSQLNSMLKEVYVRREFADRARKALNDGLKATAPPANQKQIELN
ncbi:MAG: hypothetical protein Q7N95_04065 [Alphaproteobacteria bacterium]|nr:hypothetical protein [Alphaproteobacteria bacterium]